MIKNIFILITVLFIFTACDEKIISDVKNFANKQISQISEDRFIEYFSERGFANIQITKRSNVSWCKSDDKIQFEFTMTSMHNGQHYTAVACAKDEFSDARMFSRQNQ